MDIPPAPELNSAQRKELRGKAMGLKPAVLVGKAGVTPTVLAAVNTALAREGLIKLRIEAPERKLRKEWLNKISEETHATICGEVGHTASIYRPKPVKD